jgi:hypothetical protein
MDAIGFFKVKRSRKKSSTKGKMIDPAAGETFIL